MDYLPDLVFVQGTSSFRRLQELPLVKKNFCGPCIQFGGLEQGIEEGGHPR